MATLPWVLTMRGRVRAVIETSRRSRASQSASRIATVKTLANAETRKERTYRDAQGAAADS
jgi:uncharacterized membrane protein